MMMMMSIKLAVRRGKQRWSLRWSALERAHLTPRARMMRESTLRLRLTREMVYVCPVTVHHVTTISTTVLGPYIVYI